jgi:citrate synthase
VTTPDGGLASSASVDSAIEIAGHDVVDLIGQKSLTEVMLLALDGELPSPGKARVIDGILVAIMDHGITPSALVTRLVLDGAPESMSGAVAAGLLAVGSRFLGTIEDSARLLERIVSGAGGGDLASSSRTEVEALVAAGGRVPGFGHNLHGSGDPRVVPLIELTRSEGFAGEHVAAFAALAPVVEQVVGKPLVPNAAGAVGAILIDLGYAPADLRGFSLGARCAGLFSHAVEERRQPISRQAWESFHRD